MKKQILKHPMGVQGTQFKAGSDKRSERTSNPETRTNVVEFLRRPRGRRVSVSDVMLLDKAKEQVIKLGIKDFQGSEVWFDKVKAQRSCQVREECKHCRSESVARRAAEDFGRLR